MKTRILLAMVLAVSLLAGTASATTLTFDAGDDLSAWYKDRYNPAVFEIAEFDGGSRLRHGVSSDDVWPYGTNTTFYNSQGKKFDTNLMGDIMVFSIDLFVADSWKTEDRSAGMWATGFDENGVVSAYPIIAFRGTENDARGFYTFDYYNSGYVNYTAVTDYDQWYNLKFVVTKGVGVEYFVNDALIGTFDDVDTASLGNVILNAYNYGDSYDIYWDNFQYDAIVVPEPATMTLLGLGLGGLALSRIRRRKAA